MMFPAGMTLLHPWAAALGAAAVGLPVAIHYLTRPRPVRMALSTIRFVREAVREKRAAYRLRDILILLLRTTAVLLIAWAFARPTIGAKPATDVAAAGTVSRVILIDDGLSMAAVSNSTTAFDRARVSAAPFLRYQTGLSGDLIFIAARPQPVFEHLSSNISALRDALEGAAPRPQRSDVQAALNKAGEIFASSPQNSMQKNSTRLELIVISNFQRNNWSSVDFSPIPKDAVIRFESVAPERQPDNLAILRVGFKGRMERGRDVRLEAEIGNYSNTSRDTRVEVDLGAVSYHLQGVCPPGVATTLSSLVTMPAAAGFLTGEAKLIGTSDALAADDRRPLAIRVGPLPMYALLTREPSAPHPSSSHFLERALVPGKSQSGGALESVVRMDPSQLDRNAVASASLLVLDHPGFLSDETINLLATAVRRGRGMMYVAAEAVDAQNLARFARSAGADLKMPVDLVPADTDKPRHDLFLLEWRRDELPFSQLGDLMPRVAGNLRFNRGLDSHRLAGGLIDDVLASFSDRSAFLVVTPCGAGNIAILNADLMASNLPSSPLFVPLVEEVSGRLLAVNDSTDAVACGEPLEQYLPPDCGRAESLKIKGVPSGFGSLSDQTSGVLWHADAAETPGNYEIQRGDTTVFALAVAPPASQSDLQTIDPSTLTSRLAAGRRAAYETAGHPAAKDDAWAWLLVGCTGCLIVELFVLKLFRT